jgi:hypothetical protein
MKVFIRFRPKMCQVLYCEFLHLFIILSNDTKRFFPSCFVLEGIYLYTRFKEFPGFVDNERLNSLVKPIPFKIISLSSFPILEVPFKGCLLNHSVFICCIPSGVLCHLKSSSCQCHFYFWKQKKAGGDRSGK